MNTRNFIGSIAAPVAAIALLGLSGAANATLLTAGHETQLETWLGEGPLTFTNIYTRTAGDTSATFHAAVNGMGRTFSLIRVSGGTNDSLGGVTPGPYGGGTQLIGGYNPQSWHSGNFYNITPMVADMTGFIFNLTQSLMKEQTDQYQTLNHASFGPVFGGGYDLRVIGVDTVTAQTRNYCDAGTVTKPGLCWYGSSTPQFNILNEAYYTYNVTVEALEVYTIAADTTPMPEAGTLALFGIGLAGLGMARRRKVA